MIGEACVVVGNFLLEFDYDTMARVWRVPSESFRDLSWRALRDHVTTLKQLLGEITADRLRTTLAAELPKALGRPVLPDTLSDEEIQAACQVGKELVSPEFLDLHRPENPGPMRSLKISARAGVRAEELVLDSRRVPACFLVREETIAEVRIDSVSARTRKIIESRLRGTPYRGWRERLGSLCGISAP